MLKTIPLYLFIIVVLPQTVNNFKTFETFVVIILLHTLIQNVQFNCLSKTFTLIKFAISYRKLLLFRCRLSRQKKCYVVVDKGFFFFLQIYLLYCSTLQIQIFQFISVLIWSYPRISQCRYLKRNKNVNNPIKFANFSRKFPDRIMMYTLPT